VKVAPSAAGVGDAVIGSVFGVSEQTRSEFPVKATWSISAPGYFKSGHTDTHSVSFSSDDPESVQVTAVNKGPPGRQGSASAQFVKVVSIEAAPAIVGMGSMPEFIVTTNPEGYERLVHIAYDPNTLGAQEVVATCGSSSARCEVTVVGVKRIVCEEYNVVSETDDPGETETVYAAWVNSSNKYWA